MKRRLNKKGKVLFTSLTIMLSVVIYVLVVFTGVFQGNSGIVQLGLVFAWIWLLFGQFGAYALIWERGE